MFVSLLTLLGNSFVSLRPTFQFKNVLFVKLISKKTMKYGKTRPQTTHTPKDG